MNLSKYIDHTNLKPTATTDDIKTLCREAMEHNFYAVCVNACFTKLAVKELKNSTVKVAAVVGFPLGATTTEVKIFEAGECVSNGAGEIDMVLNIGWLKSGEYERVEREIAEIKKAIAPAVLKVILETCYLTNEEKKAACLASMQAGADFVKTSTGFGTGGATIEDVELMRSQVGDKLRVKASGGIKDRETAEKFIRAGADRLGTSSGISLVKSE